MKNNYSLLPYVREDIYGIDTNQQIIGWEIEKFNIKKQWNKSKGEEIKIAVIDTGCCLEHKDIRDNLIQGKNFVEPKSEPYDKNGHGTHVTGTISAIDNSYGMVGVSPKSKVMPVKALGNNGSGNLKNIIDAILWSTDNGADLITMSLGSPSSSRDLYEAIKYAENKGSIIFCAAGNSGQDSDIMYPAKYEETISIGAIDENLNRTSFSCSGEELDFLAPGHNILSCVPGNKYALMSGTSMSNPFAVGCAALVLSYNKKRSGKKMSKKDIVDYFRKTALPLKERNFRGIKKYQGYGVIYPVL
jgi:major intracellular serine protease